MTPSIRKPAGILLLICGIALYAGGVALLAPQLAQLPHWALVPVYLLLGIAWLAPLAPLLRWMQTGRWGASK